MRLKIFGEYMKVREAITKDQYEARLKTDMVVVLNKIRAEIEQLHYHPKLDFIRNDDVVEMVLDIIDKYKGDKV